MKAKQSEAPSAWFERELAASKDTPEYELAWLLLDVEAAIHKAMEVRGMSRSELAERLGTSRAFVTKLLGGHENLTLKTLIRVANALEMKVETTFVPRPVSRARRTARDHTRRGLRSIGEKRRRVSHAK